MNMEPKTNEEIFNMAVSWWREQVRDLLTRTIEYYNPKMPDSQVAAMIEVWQSDLQSFPIPAIEYALQMVRQYGAPYMPKVSEVIQEARKYEPGNTFESGTGDRRNLPKETDPDS